MNARWTREELILGLEVFFRVGREGLRPENEEIQLLSDLLRKLPIHPPHRREATFRNPDGISLTLRKFLSYDPSYTGVGLNKEGGLKQLVWNEFFNDHQLLTDTAAAIRLAFELLAKEHDFIDQNFALEEAGILEGSVFERLHRLRERNPSLVLRKKNEVQRISGALRCEVCEFDFALAYGELGTFFAECHHIRPMAELTQPSHTRLSDLVIVCSNCHRMLHRRKPCCSIEELRSVVQTRAVHGVRKS